MRIRHLLPLAALLVAPAMTQASLIGDDVDYCVSLTNDCLDTGGDLEGTLFDVDADNPELEGAVIDVVDGQIEVSIDVEAESVGVEVLWTADTAGPDGPIDYEVPAFEFILSDLDWLDELGNPVPGNVIGLVVEDAPPELTVDIIDSTDDSIRINFTSFDFNEDEFDAFDLFLTILVEHTAVPTPAPLALLGLGLVLLGLRSRRV